MIRITLETGVGVQSAILHVCPNFLLMSRLHIFLVCAMVSGLNRSSSCRMESLMMAVVIHFVLLVCT